MLGIAQLSTVWYQPSLLRVLLPSRPNRHIHSSKQTLPNKGAKNNQMVTKILDPIEKLVMDSQ